MKTHVVLAGSLREFSFLASEILEQLGERGRPKRIKGSIVEGSAHRLVYAKNSMACLGLKNWNLIKVGSWYQNPEWTEENLKALEQRQKMSVESINEPRRRT